MEDGVAAWDRSGQYLMVRVSARAGLTKEKGSERRATVLSRTANLNQEAEHTKILVVCILRVQREAFHSGLL
jgi:hypothetical protein